MSFFSFIDRCFDVITSFMMVFFLVWWGNILALKCRFNMTEWMASTVIPTINRCWESVKSFFTQFYVQFAVPLWRKTFPLMDTDVDVASLHHADIPWFNRGVSFPNSMGALNPDLENENIE